MEVLWQESPLSSLEVVSRLHDQGWNEKTVKTFLNRLVKKNVVSFKKDGRRYLYSPVVMRDAFLAQESEGFLDKIFKGDMKELLATFVQNKQLSEQELDYLRELLDKTPQPVDKTPRRHSEKQTPEEPA
jgi:BlaI family penicillinase repressor